MKYLIWFWAEYIYPLWLFLKPGSGNTDGK